MAACRKGEALVGRKASTHNDFQPLLDCIALTAAAASDYVGFDGRILEVREAGEDAWLGLPAAADPALDAPARNLPVCVLDGAAAVDNANEAVGIAKKCQALAHSAALEAFLLLVGKRHWSFRSLQDALAAARDGDIIQLQRGTHNGLGKTATVDKRVLIRGEGSLREARLDHRANSPAFHITANCIIMDLDIDMTGFCEAVLISGIAELEPRLEQCFIRCSGDDAVNVSGSTRPLFVNCQLQGNKCGLRAFDAAAPNLVDCCISKCGEQGLKAFDTSRLILSRSNIVDCSEEAIIATDSTSVQLSKCQMLDCKGPAVDLTDRAAAQICDCAVRGCVGSVWLWDESTAEIIDTSLQADAAYVLVSAQSASLRMKGCAVVGRPYPRVEEAWLVDNTVSVPKAHIGAPPEDGPFEFVPNGYRRKQ